MRQRSIWLSMALLGLILLATVWPSLAAPAPAISVYPLADYPGPYPGPTAEHVVMLPVTLRNAHRCDGSQQVLQNGGFEEGWAWWSLSGDPLLSTDTAASGQNSALLAGYNDSRDELRQTVSVPAWAETGKLYISWLMQTIDSATTDYDYLYITVRDLTAGQAIVQVYVANNTPTGAWYWSWESIPDVAARRGHSLQVEILAWTDESLPTVWFVDDVKLVFACGSALASDDVWGEPLDGGRVPEGSLLR
ncbi:MAG: hypothetical protein ACYC5M_12170 [Anaerolineae bacterium]